MKDRGEIIAGLDIGGKKISVIVGEIRKTEPLAVLGVWQQPSDGIRDGAIVNVDLAANSIRRAINKAETNTSYNIDYVQVGISDNRMAGFDSLGIVVLGERPVEEDDIQTAFEIAKAVKLPNDRQVLLLIPQYHSVDGIRSTRQPLGMEGLRLEVFAHLITCPSVTLYNTFQAMEKVGLKVNNFSAKHTAAALAVSNTFEKEIGVIVIDIGESGTGVVAYKDSSLLYSSVIPWGARDITADIAKGFRVSEMEAVRIKERFGCAFLQMVNREAQIEVWRIGSAEGHKESKRRLAMIIEARFEEILFFVAENLSRKVKASDFQGGVILTGATAIMEGAVELAQRVFGIPARIGSPQGLGGLAELASTPQYATAAGLLMECSLELENKRDKGMLKAKTSVVGSKIKSLMADWF